MRTVFQVTPEPRPLAVTGPMKTLLLYLVGVVVTNDQSRSKPGQDDPVILDKPNGFIGC